MRSIKNYIKEYIKKFILLLLHDYIEKTKRDIKEELIENGRVYIEENISNKIQSNIEDINKNKKSIEELKEKESNNHYVSLPNEKIIGSQENIKDGTISYDYLGSKIIENIYLDGKWIQLNNNNNIKEVQTVKNYVNIDNGLREFDKDLIFSKDKSIVITDSLNHDDKYKITIKSSNLFLEKIT